VIWCEGHLSEQRLKRENMSFRKYVEGFWLPSGAYAQAKTSRGFTISPDYLKIADVYTRTHLVPMFGTFRLRDITTRKIDDWIVERRKASKLAPATINRLLHHLKTILGQAASEMRLGEICGLLVQDLHRNRIEIRHNWQDGEGLKAPKLSSNRDVPISDRVAKALDQLLHESLVFYGTTKEIPLPKYTIEWSTGERRRETHGREQDCSVG